MPGAQILLYLNDPEMIQVVEHTILLPAGYAVTQVTSREQLENACRLRLPDAILMHAQVFDSEAEMLLDGMELAADLLERHPSLAIMLIANDDSSVSTRKAMQEGVANVLVPPLRSKELLQAVRSAVLRHRRLQDWARQEVRRTTSSLQQQISVSEAERQKLETLLNGIQDGVILIDPGRRLMLINQAARAIFGIGREAVEEKPVSQVVQHAELLDLLSQERFTRPSRGEINLEDGRVFNALITPIPELGLAITLQDITHLKELDRIKSDFVNTVSHDLRSPLTAILGYVELIEKAGPVNAEQRDFIQRILFSVQNITALINDLLDLGRIEAGFDTNKEIVPLGALIHYAVDGFRTRLEEKAQELRVRVPDDLPGIYGNPVRLRQMLSNLIGNAVKYTPEGGEITIEARAESGQVILRVHDTGVGIPPAEQPYIFDRFYRASNVNSLLPGTGLGLAIVKSIVDNHYGRIWVDSSPGEGTTFTVILPVKQRENPP